MPRYSWYFSDGAAVAQAKSAGTISVAICPGAVRAATRASAASCPIPEAADGVRSHFEYGRAIASMSE